MKTQDYINFMKDAGWTKGTTGGGVTSMYIELEDRRIVSFAHFLQSDYRGVKKFTFVDESGVGADWYSKAWKYVEGSNRKACSFTKRNKRDEFVTEGDCTPEFIQNCTDKVIDWAEQVNLEEALRNPSEEYFNVPSGLMSLGLFGETDKLAEYLEVYDTLGAEHVPSRLAKLRRSYLENALALSKDKSFPRPDFLKKYVE